MNQSKLSALGHGASHPGACVKIIEQPANKSLRFRYECEGRSAGSLPGVNSTHDRKTFPKIQVVNAQSRPGQVVVSCVTADSPYKPHPHNLVGKEGCRKGVCTLPLNTSDMTCEFNNLGIQCVKKKDIEESLKLREEMRLDPFRTGFSHKSSPGSIDLNAVRLCFQVFLEGSKPGTYDIPLRPVVSDPIYDKKAINDLVITKLSHTSCSVLGDEEIILLCDKVSKDDIQIRFFEEDATTGDVTWEGFGDFTPSDVHKQFAISFRTPQYKTLQIDSSVKVKIELLCPSKNTKSESKNFEYIPLSEPHRFFQGHDPSGSGHPVPYKRKRQNVGELSSQLHQLSVANGSMTAATGIAPSPTSYNAQQRIGMVPPSNASLFGIHPKTQEFDERAQSFSFVPTNTVPSTSFRLPSDGLGPVASYNRGVDGPGPSFRLPGDGVGQPASINRVAEGSVPSTLNSAMPNFASIPNSIGSSEQKQVQDMNMQLLLNRMIASGSELDIGPFLHSQNEGDAEAEMPALSNLSDYLLIDNSISENN